MAYNERGGRRTWQSGGRSGNRYGRQSSYRRGSYQSNQSYNPSRFTGGDGRTGSQAVKFSSYSRGGGRTTSRRPSRGVQKQSGSRQGFQTQYQQRSGARTGRYNDSQRGGSSRGSRSRGRVSRGRGSRGRGRGSSGVPMTREQLDAEMEDYFKKDKSRGSQLLDEELDDYFAPRKGGQQPEATVAEQEDVAMAE